MPNFWDPWSGPVYDPGMGVERRELPGMQVGGGFGAGGQYGNLPVYDPGFGPLAPPAAAGGGFFERLFGGGGGGGGDSLYAGLLTPQQQSALRRDSLSRELAAMAGAFAKAAQPSIGVPGPGFGAAFGSAANAASGAGDAAQSNMMQVMLRQLQAKKLKSEMEAQAAQERDVKAYLDRMRGGGGAGPSTAAPGQGPLVAPASAVPSPTDGPLSLNPPSLDPLATPSEPPTYAPTAAAAPDTVIRPTAGGGGSSVLQPMVQTVASTVLPPGYRVAITSADRPGARVQGTGGVSQHSLGNAIDVAIIDPQGRQIPNEGEDTTGLYSKLAVAMHQAAPPEMKGQLAWGGNFTTGPAGGPRDLMHFDLAGDRGRYGTLAALAARAGGGPDTVIPSGGGPLAPPAVRAAYGGGGAPAAVAPPGAQYAQAGGGGAPMPSRAPAAPAAPQAGGLQRQLEELAALSALAKVRNQPDPWGPMAEQIRQSPAYQAERRRAEKDVDLQYAGPLAGRAAAAQQPFTIEGKRIQADLDRETNAINERIKAGLDVGNTLDVIGEDGKTYTIPATRADIADALTRRGVAPQPVPGASGKLPPGTIVGKRALSEEDKDYSKLSVKIFEEDRKAASTAGAAILNANDMRALLDQGVIAGAVSDKRLQLAKFGQMLGLAGKSDKELIAATEAYIARAGNALITVLPKLGPPISEADILVAKSIAGGQNLTIDSMRKLLDIEEKYHRRALQNFNKNASNVKGDGQYPMTITEPPVYEPPDNKVRRRIFNPRTQQFD